MNKKLKIRMLFVCMLAFVGVQAQDLHFSQFYNNPLTTNPANTGFIPDADYRLGATYRNQYSTIMDVPYKTISAFGDAQVFRDRLENGWVGLGGYLLNDEAGSGGLKSTKVYGSVAYHQLLGLGSLLSAGFNVGYASKRIDQSKLKFPDQFDGKFFDGGRTTAVNLSNSNVSYFDMQVGMNYAYFPVEDIYINAGYSVLHVNRPKESFFNDKTSDGIIPIRQTAFVNGIFKVQDNIILRPNIYYSTQAGSREIVGGMIADFNLSQEGKFQFFGGAYYRYQDAIIPVAGLKTNNLELTFSYDATTSNLKNFNNYRGAAEFSIVKKGFYPQTQDRATLCPSF